MAQVLIRNIDDDVIANLKIRAELKGKPLEQELRDILTFAAPLGAEERLAVSKRLRERFTAAPLDIKALIRAGRDDEFFEFERDNGPS